MATGRENRVEVERRAERLAAEGARLSDAVVAVVAEVAEVVPEMGEVPASLAAAGVRARTFAFVSGSFVDDVVSIDVSVALPSSASARRSSALPSSM